MNSRHLNSGIQHPRHPSLDNLRRAQINGTRSYPQLPSDTVEGTNRVRFESDEIFDDSPLDVLPDVVYGAAALVSSIGLLTILILLYLIIRPFSVSMARRLAAHHGASCFIDAMALLLPNLRICLTGDSDVPSPVGTSILVCNHLMDGDWLTILMLGRCVGLRGSVKVFLRNEILQLKKQQNSERQTRRRNSSPASLRPALAGSISNGGSAVGNGSTTSVSESLYLSQRTNSTHPSTTTTTTTTSASSPYLRHPTSPDMSMIANLLHTLLEFPLMDRGDYIADREKLFQLLRSFAERDSATTPVHLLFFPEGWSLHNGEDRKSVLARSNEFAKREGRPQLKHLLLPRTTGFSASLDSLRESSPVVYDVTMAHRGYDGSLPPKYDLSLVSLWSLLRRKYPEEVHIRIKRYSMEEVLSDASWLDKKWSEKDRLLHHFARHQSFPTDNRGFCRHRAFDTRFHSLETSVMSLARLLLLPCAVPMLIFLSIPILWTVFWAWLLYSGFKAIFPDPQSSQAPGRSTSSTGETGQTPRCDSAAGTPFFPATPFASPSVSNWRDMLVNKSYDAEEK